MNHVLETLDIDIGRVLALEEIHEERLGLGVSVGSWAVKGSSRERDQRLQSDSSLCVLELGERAESLRVDLHLHHFQHLVVEHAGKGDGVGPLLAVAAKDHQTGVVLFGEEFKRRSVFEGMDVVLLVELDAERALERVKIRHGQVDNLRGRSVLEEERHLVVFVHLRRLLLHGTLAARILGLTVKIISKGSFDFISERTLLSTCLRRYRSDVIVEVVVCLKPLGKE